MQKYIAFGLYRKNEAGGHQEVKSGPREGSEVYLAEDVQATLRTYGRHLDNCEAASCGVFDDNRSARQCTCGLESLMVSRTE